MELVSDGGAGGNVRELPWAWKIVWVDVSGRKRTSLVRGPCPVHIARLAVGSTQDDFYEFLGEPERVVRRARA